MATKRSQFEIVQPPQVGGEVPAAVEWFDYYPNPHDPEEPKDGSPPLKRMTEDEILELYQDRPELTHSEYAGIFLDDNTLYFLLERFTGEKGVFQLEGYIHQHDRGALYTTEEKARIYSTVVGNKRGEAYRLLAPILREHGVAEDGIAKRIDAIIEELRAEFSGDPKKTKHAREERDRLHPPASTEEAIGKVAARYALTQ